MGALARVLKKDRSQMTRSDDLRDIDSICATVAFVTFFLYLFLVVMGVVQMHTKASHDFSRSTQQCIQKFEASVDVQNCLKNLRRP